MRAAIDGYRETLTILGDGKTLQNSLSSKELTGLDKLRRLQSSEVQSTQFAAQYSDVGNYTGAKTPRVEAGGRRAPSRALRPPAADLIGKSSFLKRYPCVGGRPGRRKTPNKTTVGGGAGAAPARLGEPRDVRCARRPLVIYGCDLAASVLFRLS
ncbi:hypothetical protein EVAR_18816_1 [Eumeta japonica]|uniref:Uncharacterized protein n=1 Tax=Eumeta variegata TaxID=151549 RepID=A0A4C1ULJ8_EUMVA|nr:hypothetical protein EVAR_18816_1 [Eumeta japonica]